MVGVNRYTEGDEQATEILRIDPLLEARQIESVRAVRANRDESAVSGVLRRIITAAADPEENLMPLLIEAGRAHVSEGEIVQALQSVWGDYREMPAF